MRWIKYTEIKNIIKLNSTLRKDAETIQYLIIKIIETTKIDALV
jgi:hypothetical protein